MRILRARKGFFSALRYTDCNGDCPIMPDGFIPDVKSEDDPFDGAALGDPEETMLAAALSLASGVPATRSSKIFIASEKPSSFVPADFQPSRPSVLVSSRGPLDDRLCRVLSVSEFLGKFAG